jgi:hypothetical protein
MLGCPLNLPLDMALLALKAVLPPAAWLKNVLPGVGIDVKPANSSPCATKVKNLFKNEVKQHHERAPGQGSGQESGQGFGQGSDQESDQETILAHISCRDALENLKKAGVVPSRGHGNEEDDDDDDDEEDEDEEEEDDNEDDNDGECGSNSDNRSDEDIIMEEEPLQTPMQKAVRGMDLVLGEKEVVQATLKQIVAEPNKPQRTSDAPAGTLQPPALGLGCIHRHVLRRVQEDGG